MEQPISFVNGRALRLSGIQSRPAPSPVLPLVVICHGFGGDKNAEPIPHLVRALDRLGIASLRFDFAGHGASDGEIAQLTVSRGVDDLRSAFGALAECSWVDRSKLGLFGYSFGGAVALWYAADHHDLKALSLLAPVSDYAAVKERKHGREGIRKWRAEGSIAEDTDEGMVRLSYEFYEDARSRDSYRLARRVDLDCLLVHGERDDVVPLDQSRALADALGPRARLRVVPNATHVFEAPDQMETAVGEVARFFESRLGAIS